MLGLFIEPRESDEVKETNLSSRMLGLPLKLPLAAFLHLQMCNEWQEEEEELYGSHSGEIHIQIQNIKSNQANYFDASDHSMYNQWRASLRHSWFSPLQICTRLDFLDLEVWTRGEFLVVVFFSTWDSNLVGSRMTCCLELSSTRSNLRFSRNVKHLLAHWSRFCAGSMKSRRWISQEPSASNQLTKCWF